MLTSLFVTLAGLVSAAGGVGAAALFWPSFGALLKSVFDFLRSPLGIALGGIAGAFMIYALGWIGGDIHGTRVTRAEWRADRLARAKAEASRELALRVEMKREADAGLARDLIYSRSIDQRVHDYVAQTPALACRRATRDDIRRLLSIQ